MAVEIVARRCPQDHRCPAVRACPFQALKQAGVAAPTVDAELCRDCNLCARVCPMEAIRPSFQANRLASGTGA